MPDFTHALSVALDARRNIFHGSAATLALMDYARPNHRGYDVIKNVPSGWHLSGGTEIDEPLTLEIAESDTITAELLGRTTTFGINGKIYKMVEGGRQAPTYPAKRVWKFSVVPTGEVADF